VQELLGVTSKSHAWCLLLAWFVRETIPGFTPWHMFKALSAKVGTVFASDSR